MIFEKDSGGRNLVQQVKYAETKEIAKAVKEAKVKNTITSTIAGFLGGVATMFSGISQAIGSEVLNDEVIRDGVLHVNEKAGTIGQNIQIGKPSQGTWQGLLEGIAGNGHAGVGYTGQEAKVYEAIKSDASQEVIKRVFGGDTGMGAKWIADATGENVAGGASAALNDSLWNVENPISLSDRKVSFNSDINFQDIIDKTVKQGDKLAENVKGLILGTQVALSAFIGSNGGSKREESKVTAGNFTFYDTDYQPPTPIPFADDEPRKLAVIPKKPTTPPPTNNVLKPKPAFQEKPSTQFPTAETPKQNFLPISHPTVPFSQPQLKPASPESIEKDKQQITEFRKKAEEATALARILEGKSVESKTDYPNEKVLSDTFRDVQNEGIYNTKANDPNFGHMVRQVGLNEAHKQQEGLAKLHAVLNNKQLLSDNSQSVDDVVKNPKPSKLDKML